MIIHEDPLKYFLPQGKVNFVILGTMVAINARVIDGVKPQEEVFYYNNNRNHFWRVLQALLEPQQEPRKRLSIQEKKALLEKHGIAICNLVRRAEVPVRARLDPSDTVLFDAYKKNRIAFKKVPPRVRKVLQEAPLYFTCRRKKGIENLLDGFFATNGIDPRHQERIWFWATPTRCNPQARAKMWKEEMLTWSKQVPTL